jgi:hypothetical protein
VARQRAHRQDQADHAAGVAIDRQPIAGDRDRVDDLEPHLRRGRACHVDGGPRVAAGLGVLDVRLGRRHDGLVEMRA